MLRAVLSTLSFALGVLVAIFGVFGPFNAIQGTQMGITAVSLLLIAIYLKPGAPHDS